ncbi:putative cobalt transporter subunit (CbtB) [mine drainage metagenome]|uniref:Putative cobalt transporter subunit (CbtB) n=1 Tax=mine drainage metagenome TaxID=410659 RepID=A0A1J5QN79_9ZZZZ
MHIVSGVITHTEIAPTRVESATIVPVLMAALLGLAIIFVAGFTETSVLHNATHDARHSAGFPCH